jgi:hypothetical protein
VRMLTEETLASLLRNERARVIHAVLVEVDAFNDVVRPHERDPIRRLHERIAGLFAVLDLPAGDDSNGRRQTGGQGAERPDRGPTEHSATGRREGVEATVVSKQWEQGIERERGVGGQGGGEGLGQRQGLEPDAGHPPKTGDVR